MKCSEVFELLDDDIPSSAASVANERALKKRRLNRVFSPEQSVPPTSA